MPSFLGPSHLSPLSFCVRGRVRVCCRGGVGESGSDGVDRHLRPRVVARPAAAAAKELTERPISRCGGGSRATPTLPPHTPCARVPSRRHARPSPEPVGGAQLPSPSPSRRGARAPSSRVYTPQFFKMLESHRALLWLLIDSQSFVWDSQSFVWENSTNPLTNPCGAGGVPVPYAIQYCTVLEFSRIWTLD